MIGFVLFSLVTVLGISFTKNVNFTYILADCAWQIAEQVFGGVVIGLGKLIIFESYCSIFFQIATLLMKHEGFDFTLDVNPW